jgi:ABC-type sugar transport system ATPase subunit
MVGVRVESVTKRFGRTTAVDNVSIDINDCEFLALVGPSGCGKSSTLRMISGLDLPTSGSIWFGDQDVSRLAPDKRDVAMVFQSYALYPHMSVRENLAFPLKNMRLPKAEIAARVQAASTMLALSDYLDRRPRELSGGQRQRVALGRAVVRENAVFLFDEPLSNLDARMRLTMRTELKRLHDELDQTFIYVTHDQAEAMTMADRIAVMSDGRLQQLGTPDDIYARPANRFVAGFVGSPPMNFITATVVMEHGQPSALPRGANTRIDLADRALGGSDDGAPFTLGVRPDAFRLTGVQEGVLCGTVVSIEPLPPDLFVIVDIGSGTVVVRTSTSARPAVGDRVDLALDPSGLHVFDEHDVRVPYRSEN